MLKIWFRLKDYRVFENYTISKFRKYSMYFGTWSNCLLLRIFALSIWFFSMEHSYGWYMIFHIHISVVTSNLGSNCSICYFVDRIFLLFFQFCNRHNGFQGNWVLSQCGKPRIFLPLRFSVKSISVMYKFQFDHIEFCTLLDTLNSLKLVSDKIWMTE